MLLTVSKLNELNAALDAVRVASNAPGNGCFCTAPNVDPETRENFRLEKKSARTRRHVLEKYGHEVVEHPDGSISVKIPLGVHGRAYLGIDPQTGQVCCAKCAGEV